MQRNPRSMRIDPHAARVALLGQACVDGRGRKVGVGGCHGMIVGDLACGDEENPRILG
jgi:hypothetical protein